MLRRTFLSFVLAAACCAHAGAAPAADSGTRDLHDVRYGEILVVTGRPMNATASVYNTIGLNDCPDEAWKKIDPAALKKQLKATAVMMNGPRHFLMNRIKAFTPPGPVTTLGGLQFRSMATVPVPVSALMRGKAAPYTVSTVNRTTEYTFDKGNTVFELTSPAGDIYVMQSYAQIVDPSLTLAALPDLGKRLKLPKGWKYQSRTLTAPMKVTAIGGKAYVVQDELQNTYQRRAK